MKWAITIIMLMPMWIYLFVSNHEEALQTKLKAELKDGLKLATHDAALQIDPMMLEQGKVVFLEDAVDQAFRSSIERTFKLDLQLQPLQHSIWKNTFEIVLLDRVDEGSFPQNYYSGAPYYYSDVLTGPSIITIVKVKHPKYYGISRDFDYVIGSSHEYVR
ncbi:MAG TPA: hypothetical protein IAA29_21270 [Candidatus Paenibacillus intestinavium]|nr:hypothetical protein [Candidatus Paenibacillus intestinavium]